MKAFIVGGGGCLGSTTAYFLGLQALADEIVIYDEFQPIAQHHVFDLSQSLCLRNNVKVSAGTWDDIAGADVVICAAGLRKDWLSQSNTENLRDLHDMIVRLATALRDKAPNAVTIIMTNPVDLCTYMLWKCSGLPKSQFIGFGLNDTLRFREGIAYCTGEKATDVNAYVVGEHGKTKVQLYSSVCVKGKPFAFSDAEKQDMEQKLNERWKAFLGLGIQRTAGWTSASAIGMIVEAICGRRDDILPCSVIADGAYGMPDVAIGLPVKLCANGVKEIVNVPLTAEEQDALLASANYLRATLDEAAVFYTP